jgi:cysteine desulfurase/selenocysteine lyase
LDSAATAQRPKAVVDAVSNFLLTANANPHRGAYTLGGDATAAYEGASARTAAFLGVPAEELVMLGSATEALNLVARSWGRANLSRGDVVLVTEAEHHANLIPWQQVTREVDADLEFIPVDDVTGEILWDRLEGLLKLRPKIVAVGHVSNVLGSAAPLAQIAPQIHAAGGLLAVDGCQAVANMPVNIPDTGADFYAFSAHKMGALFSGGGLWARAHLLNEMNPTETGGDSPPPVISLTTLGENRSTRTKCACWSASCVSSPRRSQMRASSAHARRRIALDWSASPAISCTRTTSPPSSIAVASQSVPAITAPCHSTSSWNFRRRRA